MAERHNTGGTREFHYEKEDLKRIRSTDTESTKAFKEAYSVWQAGRETRKLEEEMRKQRLRMTLVLAFLFVALSILLLLRFFK